MTQTVRKPEKGEARTLKVARKQAAFKACADMRKQFVSARNVFKEIREAGYANTPQFEGQVGRRVRDGSLRYIDPVARWNYRAALRRQGFVA